LISYGSGSFKWDGTNDAGQMVQSGQYLVKVTRSTGMGQTEVFSQSVTVLEGAGNSLSSVQVLPNPSTGLGPVTILISSGPLTSLHVEAKVYDLAGGLVARLDNGGSAPSIAWVPGRSASGIYLIRLTAKDSQGKLSSRTLKAVLLR
jgi:hypothetical protein